MDIISSLKSVGTTISLIADVIALKVLKGMSPANQAFLGRITGGLITNEACAQRASYNATMLDKTCPLRTIFGVLPSKLIVTMTKALTDSAAAKARELANTVEERMAIGKALGELLPAAGDAYNELDNLIAGAKENSVKV